jgi:hypothetical protein
MPLEQTENFLGITADAAYYLLWRTAREDNLLTAPEKEQVFKLYRQARYLKDSLGEIAARVVEQDLKLVEVQRLLWRRDRDEAKAGANLVIEGLSLMETGLGAYPEINLSGDLAKLAGPDPAEPPTEPPTEPPAEPTPEPEKDIGVAPAIQRAKDFWLGANASGFQGRVAYESVGDIPAYSIELFATRNGAAIPFAEVDVAKGDGRVLWAMSIPDASRDESGEGAAAGMTNPPASFPEQLAQGGRRALDFLACRDFPEMALAYSQEEGGYGVYTLTPLQEGVRLYADQVKIQVDLWAMNITGYEGTPFYRNHKRRVLTNVAVTRDKLLTFISPYLRVEETNLALIRDDWGKEILTWEVRALVGQERFSLYYNCITGAEEKILRL